MYDKVSGQIVHKRSGYSEATKSWAGKFMAIESAASPYFLSEMISGFHPLYLDIVRITQNYHLLVMESEIEDKLPTNSAQ